MAFLRKILMQQMRLLAVGCRSNKGTKEKAAGARPELIPIDSGTCSF